MLRRGLINLTSVMVLGLIIAISPLVQMLSSSESITIRTQPVTVFDINREYIYLEYRGTADIVMAVVKSDPGILVEGAKQVGDSTIGYVKISLLNATSKSYLCTLSMMSLQPFSVNVSSRSGELATSLPQIISVPANITAQIEIPVIYGSYQQPVQIIPTVGYSPSFPIWALIAYIVIIPMFIFASYMDNGSLKAMRRRWSAFDTFALTVRYVFYSLLVIFVLITFGVVFEFFAVRFYSLAMQLHVGDWLFSCALFSAFGLLYGIGKWRGLFDNIDEED